MAGAFVAGAIVSSLILDTKKWSSSVSKVNADQAKMAGMSQKTAGKFKAVGAGMTVVGGAIVAGMGKAVAAFGDFDQAMTESTSIMGDLSAEMRKEMEQTALQMSGESIFAAKDLGEAYYFLASAGLDAEKSIAALPVVTSFATAGAFDLATATDLLTDAQSALGLTSKDTAENQENMVRISDVLVKANTLANASVQQFSEALTNKAGAAMRAYGIDTEEGVAVLAAFADQGTKGRDAGTQFSIVLRELQKAAIQNKKAFKEAGVAVYDANGNFNNMGDIVAQLEDRFDGMSAEQKKVEMGMLGFSEKSQMALLTLIGTSDKIKDYEKNLRSAGGVTEEVANKQLLGFNNQMTIAKNKMMAAAISIGEQLAPTVVSLATAISNVVSKITDWAQANPALFSTITKIVAGAGALMVVLGPIVMILPKLIMNMKLLNTQTKGASGALGKLGLVATAAFVGWEIGKQIGQMKILGKTIDDHVQDKVEKLIDTLEIYKSTAQAGEGHTAALAKRQKILADASEKAGTKITNLHDAMAILSGGMTKAEKAAAALAKQKKELKEKTEGIIKPINKLSESFKTTIQPITDVDARVIQLSKDLADGTITVSEYFKALNLLDNPLAQLQDRIENMPMDDSLEGVESLVTEWESVPDATQSVFEQIGLQSFSSQTEIEKHAKNLTQEKLPTLWDAYLHYMQGLTQNLAAGFSGIFVNLLGITESITYQMQEFDNSYYQNAIDEATRAHEEKEKLMQDELDSLIENSNDALKSENQRYREQKKAIMKHLGDEKEKERALAKLEKEHEQKRNAIIAERKKKAKELRDSLIALEDSYQTSVDTLRQDEDTARQQHADDELARQNSLWNQVKGVFGTAIESMLGAWTQDFIGGLMSDITGKLIPSILGIGGAGEEAASSLLGSFGDALGGGAGDVAGGIESVTGALSGAMNPIGMISGAVTAIASVASLFKKAGPSSTDSWHFEQIWINTKELRDYTFLNIGGSGGWLAKIYDRNTDTFVILQTIRAQQREKHLKELEKIKEAALSIVMNTDPVPGLLEDINRSIKAIPKAQHGYTSTKPELVMMHGTPAKPEHAIPDDRLRALLSAADGGGRGRGDVSLKTDQQVNFNGLMISDRDYMRTRGIPELLSALKANVGLAELKAIVGVT